MRKVKTLREKRSTFCNDCDEDQRTCGKNPIDCMKADGSKLYFEKYDKVGDSVIENMLHERKNSADGTAEKKIIYGSSIIA